MFFLKRINKNNKNLFVILILFIFLFLLFPIIFSSFSFSFKISPAFIHSIEPKDNYFFIITNDLNKTIYLSVDSKGLKADFNRYVTIPPLSKKAFFLKLLEKKPGIIFLTFTLKKDINGLTTVPSLTVPIIIKGFSNKPLFSFSKSISDRTLTFMITNLFNDSINSSFNIILKNPYAGLNRTKLFLKNYYFSPGETKKLVVSLPKGSYNITLLSDYNNISFFSNIGKPSFRIKDFFIEKRGAYKSTILLFSDWNTNLSANLSLYIDNILFSSKKIIIKPGFNNIVFFSDNMNNFKINDNINLSLIVKGDFFSKKILFHAKKEKDYFWLIISFILLFLIIILFLIKFYYYKK